MFKEHIGGIEFYCLPVVEVEASCEYRLTRCAQEFVLTRMTGFVCLFTSVINQTVPD